MKINSYTPKIICAALIIAGIALNVSSCRKSSIKTTPVAPVVTETDAAQFASDAVSPLNGGMADQLSNSTKIYTSAPLVCGDLKDSTIVLASAAGATPAYNYAFNWTYVQNCTGSVPSNISFDFTGHGTYDGTKLSSSDTSNAHLVLTGDGSNYLVTVNYTRTGAITSKTPGHQFTFHSTLNIQSSNIAIDKTSREIVSGSATVALVSVSASGKTLAFSGTLTFEGGKKASLVVNGGGTYPIQW
jgi:hypothetical protein